MSLCSGLSRVPALALEEGESWVKFYQTLPERGHPASPPPSHQLPHAGKLNWFLKTLGWKEGRAEPEPTATSSHKCAWQGKDSTQSSAKGKTGAGSPEKSHPEIVGRS